MTLAIIVTALRCASRVWVWSVGSIGVVGLGGCKGRMLGGEIRLCVGVFGRSCVVRTAA